MFSACTEIWLCINFVKYKLRKRRTKENYVLTYNQHVTEIRNNYKPKQKDDLSGAPERHQLSGRRESEELPSWNDISSYRLPNK